MKFVGPFKYAHSCGLREGRSQAEAEMRAVGNGKPHCGYCGAGCPYCLKKSDR